MCRDRLKFHTAVGTDAVIIQLLYCRINQTRWVIKLFNRQFAYYIVRTRVI
jgi:hypothetical protein